MDQALIIDCISDLHGFTPPLPGGDVLIIAGDCTASDKITQWIKFYDWFQTLNYKMKILVPGNHDGILSQCASGEAKEILDYVTGEEEFYTLLSDCSFEYKGLKFYGSPWTPEFCNWHFMKQRGPDIKKVWDMIPLDTDILITHGPPKGILDLAEDPEHKLEQCGCNSMRRHIDDLPNLKYVLFGHIHDNHNCFNGGVMIREGKTYSNGSVVKDGHFGYLTSHGNIIDIVK